MTKVTIPDIAKLEIITKMKGIMADIISIIEGFDLSSDLKLADLITLMKSFPLFDLATAITKNKVKNKNKNYK